MTLSIVSNHDCEALGRGIVTLLNDRKLAAELGANARRHGPGQLRLAAYLPKIEGIYDRLLAAPESACRQTELAASATPKR